MEDNKIVAIFTIIALVFGPAFALWLAVIIIIPWWSDIMSSAISTGNIYAVIASGKRKLYFG